MHNCLLDFFSTSSIEIITTGFETTGPLKRLVVILCSITQCTCFAALHYTPGLRTEPLLDFFVDLFWLFLSSFVPSRPIGTHALEKRHFRNRHTWQRTSYLSYVRPLSLSLLFSFFEIHLRLMLAVPRETLYATYAISVESKNKYGPGGKCRHFRRQKWENEALQVFGTSERFSAAGKRRVAWNKVCLESEIEKTWGGISFCSSYFAVPKCQKAERTERKKSSSEPEIALRGHTTFQHHFDSRFPVVNESVIG